MDTEKCRVLLTVLHERSLSAAAEALGYTPSGVSRLVDSLERETGFPLLHRGRGGVSATRACQELLPLMRRMAELDEQYQQLAHRIQGLDVGRVVAGTNYAAFYPWLSEVIAGFHHAYPGIRVELREGSSTQLGELVDHRRADFCLISQRPGRHEWVPLKDDQLMAILPPTHPLVEADRFPVERLRQEPFIEFLPGQETDNSRMLQQLQIRPKIRFATSDSRAAIAMVRAGLGITLLNDILTADLADGGGGAAAGPAPVGTSGHRPAGGGARLPRRQAVHHLCPGPAAGAGCPIGTSIPDRASKSDKNVSQLYKPAIFVWFFCEKPENPLLSGNFQALLPPVCGRR